MEVGAVDGGSPARIGTARLRINVRDVDDTSPRFDRSFYEREISEGIVTDIELLGHVEKCLV